MKAWVVMEGDYNGDWIVGAYTTQALADQHAHELGGHVTEVELRDAPLPDVADPVQQKQRAEKRALDEQRGREAYERHRLEEIRRAELVAAVKPSDHMSLCKCQTYKQLYNWVNQHGYCSFCGGFTIAAYRAHLGEAALRAKINEFDKHDREILHLLADGKPLPERKSSFEVTTTITLEAE